MKVVSFIGDRRLVQFIYCVKTYLYCASVGAIRCFAAVCDTLQVVKLFPVGFLINRLVKAPVIPSRFVRIKFCYYLSRHNCHCASAYEDASVNVYDGWNEDHQPEEESRRWEEHCSGAHPDKKGSSRIHRANVTANDFDVVELTQGPVRPARCAVLRAPGRAFLVHCSTRRVLCSELL